MSPPRGPGRPPDRGERATEMTWVRLTPGEKAELVDGLVGEETLSDVLREGGLALVRGRAAKQTGR